MKTIAKYPVAIVCIFTWIGFVCAISFMESWLKFRAPGITVPLGLGIGKLVFGMLNKIEWILAIAILLQLIFEKELFASRGNLLLWIPVSILVLQSAWLLPLLDARADLHIRGLKPLPSNLHWIFIVLECIKLAFLFIVGISFFKPLNVHKP